MPVAKPEFGATTANAAAHGGGSTHGLKAPACELRIFLFAEFTAISPSAPEPAW